MEGEKCDNHSRVREKKNIKRKKRRRMRRVMEEDEREITNSKHFSSLLKLFRELDENLTAKFHFSATFNSNQF